MVTVTDDTYNGYSNRETWAFNLHWQNDQGLYNETLDVARRYIEDTYGKADHLIHDADERSAAYYGAAEHVIKWLEEQTDPTYWRDELGADLPDLLWRMRDDVGSFWRVNVSEVADALRESLDAES